MTISVYYFYRDNQFTSDEKEIVFTSYAEFREWCLNNIEFNPGLRIYDGRPTGFAIHVGNFEIEKTFEHDVTWNELAATFGEMTRFFHINDDEEEVKGN